MSATRGGADESGFRIARVDPTSPEVVAVIERHLEFARAHTPPANVRAMGAAGLDAEGVTVYGLFAGRTLVGIGALRRLDAAHAEIKSMHTIEGARGQGFGRAMLDHLIEQASGLGHSRVSLETGTMDAFAPSRALYQSAGFEPCPPFGEHVAGPLSVCMTRSI